MTEPISDQEPNPRSGIAASALSALLPGSGQLYLGERRRGAWFLAGSLVILGGAVVVLLMDPRSLLKLAFDPEVLLALLFVNAGVFLFRTFAAIDAFRQRPGERLGRPWPIRAVVLLIGLVLLVPHALFAYYDIVQYDLINTVFAAPVTTAATTTVAPTTVPPPSTTAGADAPATTATTTTTTTTTTTVPPRLWDGSDRLNILLLGSDAGVGRTGVRTDTMILASVDVETGDMVLIGVPRNFARVPIPEAVDIWSCDCFPPILNELYQYGENHPASFPGPATPGANAIKGAISELTGLPVHFYALVALDGFVDIIDAVGGVAITVTERVYDPAYPKEGGGTEVIDLQPGEYEFDGHEALAFARSRRSSDDYDRMGRQRCVIEAVVEQADPFTLLRNFPQLAEVIKASVGTDIPLDAMPDLIDLLPLVDTDNALSLRLIPPEYRGGWTADGFGTPDVELIQEHVRIATTLPPDEAAEILGIVPLDEECG